MSVPVTQLTLEEQQILLHAARLALERAVQGVWEPDKDLSLYPESLRKNGASFVTLTRRGELRGCIGALEPYQPLIQDVQEHAIAAGLHDFRFPPVSADELEEIKIEISRLTEARQLEYTHPMELPSKLRFGLDGVILRDGWKRATFLPQVWTKLPDPEDFLDHLCSKMGSSPEVWRKKKLEVLTYEVQEFTEK